jgi:hypothetical protein
MRAITNLQCKRRADRRQSVGNATLQQQLRAESFSLARPASKLDGDKVMRLRRREILPLSDHYDYSK